MKKKLPQKFLEESRKLFGADEYESFIKSLSRKSVCGLRINALKTADATLVLEKLP